MKLAKIKIRGYKSIDELEFPIKKYGDSYTTILLGKNESGKSNVLDAMATPLLADAKEKVDFIKIKNQQNEPELVSVFFAFDFENDTSYRDSISKSLDIPDDLLSNLKITNITKEIYLQGNIDEYGIDFDVDYEKISVRAYSFIKVQQKMPVQPTVPPNVPPVPATIIEKLVVKPNSEILEEEKANYTQLDKDNFKEIIHDALKNFVQNITIPVDIWKSEDKYLIKDKIQLKDFAKSPDSNLPLKNMFYLAGYDSKEKIEQVVVDIEKDGNKRKNLKKTLSKKTTEYLNNKWEEHKISIDVDIESDMNASVSVQDNADEDHYFDMADRSQGFKQFASLLLSISISSASGDTKDHLILIDEPEVHLHPSGARFMLKELLEIGKHNYLYISTHSNFMLDRDTKDRHYLLAKDKRNLTTANQIHTDDDINDDEVLQTAFGINVISDFLSPHKLLVEGETDKKLIQKALEQVKKDHGILITNGTGSNIVATASLLSFHDINPMVINDDDEAGQKAVLEIQKISDNFKDKVFTIRNLNGSIVDRGTIEDTLPKSFVQGEANKILKVNNIKEITLASDLPFCEQIKIHINKEITDSKGKRQKVNDILAGIKCKIADEYKPTASSFKQDAAKLHKLAEAILSKFKIDIN